jgi:hypothetical protein
MVMPRPLVGSQRSAPSTSFTGLCIRRRCATPSRVAASMAPTLRPANLPAALCADLERRLAGDLGFRIAHVEELDPGVAHNNRLYQLQADNGRLAALKVYLQDDRQRLEREHGMLSFLRHRGFAGVPTPLLRSDVHCYAVYSFESGDTRPAGEWTEAHAAATGHLAAEFHAIRPSTPGADFLPADGHPSPRGRGNEGEVFPAALR